MASLRSTASWPRPDSFLLFGLLFLLGSSSSAQAGPHLLVRPPCAAPGDTVRLKGSGWPSFANGWYYPIHWRLTSDTDPFVNRGLYDENENTVYFNEGRQTYNSAFVDSSFAFRLPSNIPPGNYSLGLYQISCFVPGNQTGGCSGQTRHWCREVPFAVVSSVPNPWQPRCDLIDTLGRHFYSGRFHPGGNCSISPCKSIHLIQGIHIEGKHVGSANWDTTLTLSDLDIGGGNLDDNAQYERRTTPPNQGMWSIDYIAGARNPYITDVEGASPGRQSTSDPMDAHYEDHAYILGREYLRLNLQALRMDFEVVAFCTSGDDQGEYLGRAFWRYEQSTVDPGPIITCLGVDRSGPSTEFRQALALWLQDSGRGSFWPKPKPPTAGGTLCQGSHFFNQYGR